MKIILEFLLNVMKTELGVTKNYEYLLFKIKTHHQEEHRFYHTLTHLESMLEYYHRFENHIQNKNAVILSILFHDIIYDVKAQDNEIKSAEFAKITLSKFGFNSQLIIDCETFILASAHHKKNLNSDVNYFLDFDLNILGQSWENYNQYTQQIRKEYNIYPDTLYIPGRIKVLEHFLTFESIYKTKPFLENFEHNAQKNIKQELELLKQTQLFL